MRGGPNWKGGVARHPQSKFPFLADLLGKYRVQGLGGTPLAWGPLGPWAIISFVRIAQHFLLLLTCNIDCKVTLF